MMDYAETYSEANECFPWRDRVRGWARHGVLSVFGRMSRPSAKPTLRLLYCHHVFDDERAGFAATLDDLTHIGDFIDTKEVLRVISGERSLTRHAFHLSFDDGIRNIVTNALPILRERSVPAIMFVATALITNAAQFPHLQRLHPGAPKPFAHADWRDLERASAQGLEIGSHTRTHANLSSISISEQQLHDEIVCSKSELENRFGCCDYISWPYGNLADVDRRALIAIEKAGYRASFGAFRGRVVPGCTNRYQIPRHHFEPHWPLHHIRYFAYGAGES